MLTFHIERQGKAIQICCDDEGMAVLIKALEDVRTEGHLHLRTPENGGRELNEKDPWGIKAIGEVMLDWVGD